MWKGKLVVSWALSLLVLISLTGCGAGHLKPGLANEMKSVKRIGIIVTDINYTDRKAFYLEDLLASELVYSAKESGYEAISIPEDSPAVARIVDQFKSLPKNWRKEPQIVGVVIEEAKAAAKKLNCDSLVVVSGIFSIIDPPSFAGTATKIAVGVLLGSPVAGGARDSTIIYMTGLTPDGSVGYYERTQFTSGTFSDGSMLSEKARKKIAQNVMEQFVANLKAD